MEDLSSLSKSLHEILSAPGGGESLASTVEEYLNTPEVSTKQAVCETLLELLIEGDEDFKLKRREIVLSDTSLTYLPVLLPLSTSIPPSNQLVLLIAEFSKAREVVFGLTEGIQSILDRAEGLQVSDDEDGDFEDEEISVDWPGLIQEYELIISCLRVAIPRLTNSKSTPTLLSLSESISSSLPILAHQATTSSARVLLSGLCELVQVIWEWVQGTGDKGGEQRSILSNLLFESVTLLGHKVNAKLTERWFLATFPRFRNMPTSGESLEGWEEGQKILDVAWSTAITLNLTSVDLVNKIIDPSHITVHSSLASLNLLSSQLPNSSSALTSILDPVPPTLLDDSMTILCAALSGSSVDAGVVYTWALLHYYLTSKRGTLEYDNASMLLELLVPLTAQHPSSLMRLALFKLIGGIISLQSTVVNKMELFKQLLEPANPFDNIRIQSLSLLRENISSGELLSDVLVEILFPVLFVPPSQQDQEDDPFTYPPMDLLNSPYIAWWTECLTLLWFLVDYDKEEVSGVRQKTGEEVMKDWFGGVERKLRELQDFLKSSSDNDEDEFGGAGFMMMRLEDALNRVRSGLSF
ncbi:hypothetical protein I302_108853 [Kwoniella bestiolae CBS 10118]|uniref:Uncharacterized protein n=1 Tax=Kwoniella bestiolae CBS 10118 TaxID=1296100 RepID=A0A1B9FUA6_9TREE|nr:hypothetical protein I302_07991 [Kwoniella bestiolae CBS 10118]OCF22344.1 hypothetical protein I302_07991 [Kwoniella bestiolae CBS 10118]